MQIFNLNQISLHFYNVTVDVEFVEMFILLSLVWFTHNSIESPEVQLTSSLMIFESTEEATLQCTALGGYPPIHNISLVKNGMVILSRVSSEVTCTTILMDLQRMFMGCTRAS